MKAKDPVSGFTHLLGAILSIAGLVLLIITAKNNGEKPWDIVSFSIFGASLILLYTFSSLYHLLNIGEKATNVFRKLDHIMIFFLIAGTYTAICLGPLRGPWGWSIFGVAWGIAIIRNISHHFLDKCPKMANYFTLSLYGLDSTYCNLSNDCNL